MLFYATNLSSGVTPTFSTNFLVCSASRPAGTGLFTTFGISSSSSFTCCLRVLAFFSAAWSSSFTSIHVWLSQSEACLSSASMSAQPAFTFSHSPMMTCRASLSRRVFSASSMHRLQLQYYRFQLRLNLFPILL